MYLPSLHIHVLVQIHAANELLGGLIGRNRLVVVSEVDVVVDTVHGGLEVVPLAVMHPVPLRTEGGVDSAVNDLVAEVAVQDVRTGVEGLITAVIQIGGNRIVSTNPSGRLAGILNRYDLVDVVRSLGLAVGVLFLPERSRRWA